MKKGTPQIKEQFGFTKMSPEDAYIIKDSVEPDQTVPLGLFCSFSAVYFDLSQQAPDVEMTSY